MKVLHVLVTGANGQVGSEIKFLKPQYPGQEFVFVDVDEMDLAKSDSIDAFFEKHVFDVVINCAAYTAVDLAEQNEAIAKTINTEAVVHIGSICKRKNIRLIHISTDYVFDGRGNVPLVEDSPTNPLSVYGKTKLVAEQFVIAEVPNSYVLRTAWVYSTFGKNFVKTIANLAKEKESLSIIYDQIGAPTYARDLAKTMLGIVERIRLNEGDVPGLYNFSNEGAISWFDFAFFIVNHFGYKCKLIPIRTEQYKTLATRPRFSVLDKQKIKDVLQIEVPHWHSSLKRCLNELGS